MHKIPKSAILAVVISLACVGYPYAKSTYVQQIQSSHEITKDEEIRILKSRVTSLEKDLRDLEKAKP